MVRLARVEPVSGRADAETVAMARPARPSDLSRFTMMREEILYNQSDRRMRYSENEEVDACQHSGGLSFFYSFLECWELV